MDEISKFTHLLENVMDDIRSGKVKVDSAIIDVLLDALDVIKAMINARSSGNIYSEDYNDTINSLNGIIANTAKEKSKGKTTVKTEAKEKSEQSEVEDDKFKISEYELLELSQANPDNLPVYKIIISLDESNPMRTVGGIQIFTSLRDISHILKTVPDFEEIYSDNFHKEIMYLIASGEPLEKIREYATIPDATEKVVIIPVDIKQVKSGVSVKKEEIKTATKQKNIEEKVEDQSDSETEEGSDIQIEQINQQVKKKDIEKKDQKIASSSILRVDSSRIDVLLNLVSEIVINKATFNQIGIQLGENLDEFSFNLNEYKDKLKTFFDKIPEIIQNNNQEELYKVIKEGLQQEYYDLYNQFDNFLSKFKSSITKFKANYQILDRISSSLQEGVMRVRMVPMNQIFNRFPRLVRDLSRELKKDVELIIKGEDTEIDKAMIDDLIDPLIHIVRNSIDHGFESVEERRKLGKSVPAILEISAVNEGNVISISVADDGKGIDIEKVRQKAIEKNLISADSVIKDLDAYNLLFEPGFSTAEKVTNVSGRGVGLDVVKRNVEKLSGTIRITSELGMGTMFTIKIPLTLAIIQGLMIEVGEEIYVIPISSVIESIRIKPEEIKSIDNYEVINVRDDVLSLLRLNKLFKIESEKQSEYYFVIIVGTGNKKIGLLVDSIIGEEDIVIKPLKDKFTSTPGIAGATILGDGTVSLILDVSQLIELGLKIEEEKHSVKRS
jgi:two-component system chemotaxis sensor kinase CheA